MTTKTVAKTRLGFDPAGRMKSPFSPKALGWTSPKWFCWGPFIAAIIFFAHRCFEMCTPQDLQTKYQDSVRHFVQIFRFWTSPQNRASSFPFSDQSFFLLGNGKAWQWSVYLQRLGRDCWCFGKPSRFGCQRQARCQWQQLRRDLGGKWMTGWLDGARYGEACWLEGPPEIIRNS